MNEELPTGWGGLDSNQTTVECKKSDVNSVVIDRKDVRQVSSDAMPETIPHFRVIFCREAEPATPENKRYGKGETYSEVEDYLETRRCAERQAKSLGVPLHDFTGGKSLVESPEEIGEPLANRVAGVPETDRATMDKGELTLEIAPFGRDFKRGVFAAMGVGGLGMVAGAPVYPYAAAMLGVGLLTLACWGVVRWFTKPNREMRLTFGANSVRIEDHEPGVFHTVFHFGDICFVGIEEVDSCAQLQRFHRHFESDELLVIRGENEEKAIAWRGDRLRLEAIEAELIERIKRFAASKRRSR